MQSGGIGPLEDPNKDTAPKAVSPRKRKGKEKAEESGVDQANTKRKTGRSRREVAEPTKVEDHGDDSDVKEIIDPLPNETWKVVPNELAPPAPDSAEKVDEEGHVYCPRIWTTTKPELYGAIPTLAPTKGTNGVYSTNCDVVTVILEDNAPGVLDIVPVKTQERDGTVFDLVMSRTLVSANKNGKKNIAHQVTLFEDTEDYTFSSNLQALPDAQNVPPRAIMSISEDATGSILPASEPAAANPESTSIIESRRQSSPLPSEYFNVLSPERISELEQSRAAFNEAAAETWDMGGLNELQERLRAKVQEHKRWFSGNVVEADQEPSSRYEEPPNPYIMDVDMTLPGPSTPRMTESTVSSHRHSPAKPKDSPNRSLSPTKPRDLPASPPKARDQPARNSSAANSKEIFAHRVPFANANDPPGREHSVGIVESASARVSTRSMAEPIKEESLEPISARLSRRRQRDRAPSPTISSRASRSLPKRRDRPENCICRPGWVHAKCPACGPKIRDISDVEFSSSGEDDETLSRSASVQGLPRLDVTSGNNEDATGSCYLASPLTPLSSVPSSPERESVEPFAADVFMLRSESPLESKRQSAMGDLGQVRTPLRIRKPTKGLDLKLGEEKTAEDLPRESKRQSEMGDSGQIRIPLRIQRPAKWLDLTLGEEKTAEGLPSGRATRDKHRHREQSERRESSRAKGKDKDNVQSESASTHRKRRRSVNNSNSTQLGSSSKSTNDVLNNPNEESVSGAEDAAPSPTAKRPRRQCAETASGLIKTQVAIKKRRPRTKKVDLQEDPSGSKDGLDGGMGDTLDGATEGYYSGLPNLMPSYVDDEPAPPPRLRRKRSTRPRVQPSWSALDGSGERPFLLRGCDWSTGDSPIGGTDALFFVQQPGQERIGGDDDGGGVELMGFANMAEPTYAPDMFENVEEAASRESLEPFQDAEHDNGISMEPSEPEENISVPPIEEATGNHEITATETTVLEKQEVREPPTTSLTSLPLEVRAILDAYIQNAPVCIIIARDRATALFPLHRLSKEFAFAYMGYFDVIGIEERVVRPDGTDETTVQWKFRVQWGIGGESILKNQQNAISLPWWMDENGSSRSRASTEGTELNSQSNAKQNADRLVTPLLYLQAKEGHPNSRLKNVNQWDSHFSMVPHFMLAELTSCFSDDAFPSGWFCAECGRVNFQAAMRHRQCTSEACARSKNRPIECYARELDDIRGPHGSSPLSLPYNEYTKPAVKAISTTWKTGMKTLSYYFDGPAKKVFAKHVFTSNVPNLQTVATSLLGEIQTDVELTRAVGDSTSNPYFTRTYDLMESEVPGLVELVTAQGKIPECLSKVHRLFLSRMPYAEIAETVAKVSRFNLIGWITAGSKKTHEPFQVKESYVFILCLGCDAVITLTPVEDRLKVQKAPRKTNPMQISRLKQLLRSHILSSRRRTENRKDRSLSHLPILSPPLLPRNSHFHPRLRRQFERYSSPWFMGTSPFFMAAILTTLLNELDPQFLCWPYNRVGRWFGNSYSHTRLPHEFTYWSNGKRTSDIRAK
ncbi:hypothetical protein FA15DRAFT_64736 [Coprinopsis marcescibilis]|uniref:Uncharacterized protein n=1 Tax=Coprinopsis marcescibilis TaxID=230819 RepID=A0A5C3KPT9_COPMA|nr:hypothetical protein FA15DRAFT_64736 [Coprinopsis marcescibilis]